MRNQSEKKISQRSLKNSGLLHLLFESNNFSFFEDIIDNIIETSVLCNTDGDTLEGLDQLLKFLGYSIYIIPPFIFPLQFL